MLQQNANDAQDTTRHHIRPNGPIVLHATKVAIHVRPRSPVYSPAKYVAVAEGSTQEPDDKPSLDAGGRNVRASGGAARIREGAFEASKAPARGPHVTAAITLASSAHQPAPRRTAVVPSWGQTAPANTAARGQSDHGPTNGGHAVHGVHLDSPVPAQVPASAHTATAADRANSAAPPRYKVPIEIAPASSTQAHNLSSTQAAAAAASAISRGAGAALLAELLGPELLAPSTRVAPPALSRPGPSGAALPGASRQQSAAHPPPVAASSIRVPGFPSGSPPGLEFLEPHYGTRTAAGGYLDVPDPEEEARRARRRHRKRVARIVVDHWKAFAADALRALAARKHFHRRMLTAAWVAWQAEVGGARARFRQAAVHDLKRTFLGLGRCVKAWSAVAKRLMQLRALQEQFTIARLLRASRACVRAWRWRCHYSAEKRRRQLQAWYYWCFATLTRALRKWHRWVGLRRTKAQRVALMDSLHAAALCRMVFAAWRRRRVYLEWKVDAVARGDAFFRAWALRGALRGWRSAAVCGRAARAAGAAALTAAAGRLQAHAAAAAFREWQAYATYRRQQQQRERYSKAYMRRWWQLVAMWSWRQQAARERHLRRCAAALAQVGTRVRLALAWSRWWLAVEVLQGQRSAELRAVVLLRACWAAWRAFVEHRAAKRELTRLAIKRVSRVAIAAALATWRSRSAHWRDKAARWHRAASWHRKRALSRLLTAWRHEAARLAAKAAAAEAADDHRRQVLLRRAVRVWQRYAWRQRMKVLSVEHHLMRMVGAALHGWLRHTRYKARMELNRRRAVRHRYLTLLHSGLHAFRRTVQRRRDKLAGWADLARLHELRLARRVLAAWRQSFVPANAAKRATVRRAFLHWRAGLLRRALAGWRGEAARLAVKHARERQAAGHAALRLLRRLLVRWSAAPALHAARREAKAQRVAEAAAALVAARARRLLAAWREVHVDLVMKRFQDNRARAAWQCRVLTKALTCWAVYLARRRGKHLLNARAAAAFRLRRWRGCLAALSAHATQRRAKRRLQAVAAEHRRTGLLRRGVAALAWYARYRAAKAEGYAAARAMYVRRLQREGAVMWVQVGTARRQQRIEMLAVAQARNLARQLSRVEPFARRWLHIVRARRRERLLAAMAYAGAGAPPPPLMPLSLHAGAPLVAGAVGSLAGATGGAAYGGWAQYGATTAAGPAVPSRWQLHRTSPPRQPHAVPAPAAQLQPVLTATATVTAAASPLRRPPPRTPATLHAAWPPVRPHQAAADAWGQPVPAARQVAGNVVNTGAVAASAIGANAGLYHGVTAPRVDGALAAGDRAAGRSTAGEGGGAPHGRTRPQPRCPAFLLQQRPATVGGPTDAAHTATGRRVGAGAAAPAQGPSGAWPAVAHLPGVGLQEGPLAADLAAGSMGVRLGARNAAAATATEAAGAAAGDGWLGGGGTLQRSVRPRTTGDPGAGFSAAGSTGASSGTVAPRHVAPVHIPAPAPLFFANLPSQPPAPLADSALVTGARAVGNADVPLAVRAPRTDAVQSVDGSGLGFFWRPSQRGGEHSGLAKTEPGGAPGVSASSPSSAGITIHRPGPRPPDVLRLPTRGADSDAAASDVAQEATEGDGESGRASSLHSTAPNGVWSAAEGRTRVEAQVAAPAPLRPLPRSPPHPAMILSGSGSGQSHLPAPERGPSMEPAHSSTFEVLLQPQQHQQPVLNRRQAAMTHGSSLAASPTHPALYPSSASADAAMGLQMAARNGAVPTANQALAQASEATASLGSKGQQQLMGKLPCAPAILEDAELADLESVLLHCKSLKMLLQQLEGQGANGGGGTAAEAVAAGGRGEGRVGGEGPSASVAERQRQAAEVREALSVLRPTVEYAAARLRQLRSVM